MRVIPSAPVPALTRAEVGRLLGLKPAAVTKLLRAGYLANPTLPRVAVLCAAPRMVADPGERQPVLRQAARPLGAPPGDDTGINAGMGPEEVADQCLGWWITDPEPWVRAGLVPVTLAGFCVAVLRIDAVAESTATPPVRIRFEGACAGIRPDLADPGSTWLHPDLGDRAPLVASLLGSRAASRSGGPTAYLDGEPDGAAP